jgi:hypothetical protein
MCTIDERGIQAHDFGGLQVQLRRFRVPGRFDQPVPPDLMLLGPWLGCPGFSICWSMNQRYQSPPGLRLVVALGPAPH